MEWCQQCGVENRPQPSVGVDDDGDPVCSMHATKRNDVEVQTNKTKLDAIRRPAPSVQRTIAPPVKEAVMSLEDAPKCQCPDCEARTKSAVGYCAKHYYLSATKNKGLQPECSVCGVKLRRDNETGLCKQHRSNTHPQKATKSVAKKAKPLQSTGRINNIAVPGPEPKLVDLGKLKRDLVAKLAAIELIEKTYALEIQSAAALGQ